jgi:hypothetical protein
MASITAYLGEFQLPQLRRLARMLAAAERRGHKQLHKTDVTAAFNNMFLSPEAALLQAFQVGDLVVIPLVAGFGWCAAPAYYNVIADAIDWAHNGGLTDATLDTWAREAGHSPGPRNPDTTERSLTYVDDSCAQSCHTTSPTDMGDLKVIIVRLLGSEAYNVKKTEGPAQEMTLIGWESDLGPYVIRPSPKGKGKIYFWVFRGLSRSHIDLHDLQRAIGTLRWYSAVVPMASTFELQRTLVAGQRRAAHTRGRTFVSLPPAALRELDWWRWILAENLHHHHQLDTPVWFLARDPGHRRTVDLYTDASSEVGGGYVVPHVSFGQFRWSEAEQSLYGTAGPTDINALEFVTAICAIVANRDTLRGTLVRVHCDNTSAVSWLNKLRTSQVYGQTWVRVLISVLLTHDIMLDCVHIAGILNTHADRLSRYIQHRHTAELTAGLDATPMLSAESRRTIWSASTTPQSVEEYLALLRRAEQQP